MRFLSLVALSSFVSVFSALAADPIRVLVVSDVEGVRAGVAGLFNQHGAKAEAASDFDVARLGAADVLMLHRAEPAPVGVERRAALESFAKRGGGFVILHDVVATGEASWWKPLAGGAWTEASRKFASRMTLYVAEAQHAIARDASPFDLDDDTLYDLDLDPKVTVMASAFTPKVTDMLRFRLTSHRLGGRYMNKFHVNVPEASQPRSVAVVSRGKVLDKKPITPVAEKLSVTVNGIPVSPTPPTPTNIRAASGGPR